jgi:3-oxoacyl-[acyl-carrier-protein] synthase-1
MTSAAHVYAVGLHCALGDNYSTASEAYRAKQNNFMKSSRGPVGMDGRPITLSSAFPFDRVRNFELRLQRLFSGAVADVLVRQSEWPTMPLVLVVASWFKGHPMEARFCEWVVDTYPAVFNSVETVADGDTLGLVELVQGLQKIADGESEFVSVGALDSYMDAELLDLLALEGRLLSGFTPHGLVPGEACILLVLGHGTKLHPAVPLGSVRSVFTGFESEVVSKPAGVIGRGLAKPLRQAFDAFEPQRFLVDLNGERWRSEDVGFALSGARISDALSADFEVPLAITGDCGAANGLLLAAFALAPAETGAEDADNHQRDIGSGLAIVSTSHITGPRCVAVIQSYREKA